MLQNSKKFVAIFVCLIFLLLGACAKNQVADISLISSEILLLSHDIDLLQEELKPFAPPEDLTARVDRLQREIRLTMTFQKLPDSSLQRMFAEALSIREASAEVSTANWDKLPTNIQEQLKYVNSQAVKIGGQVQEYLSKPSNQKAVAIATGALLLARGSLEAYRMYCEVKGI